MASIAQKAGQVLVVRQSEAGSLLVVDPSERAVVFDPAEYGLTENVSSARLRVRAGLTHVMLDYDIQFTRVLAELGLEFGPFKVARVQVTGEGWSWCQEWLSPHPDAFTIYQGRWARI